LVTLIYESGIHNVKVNGTNRFQKRGGKHNIVA